MQHQAVKTIGSPDQIPGQLAHFSDIHVLIEERPSYSLPELRSKAPTRAINERYVGSQQDLKYIQAALTILRAVLPNHQQVERHIQKLRGLTSEVSFVSVAQLSTLLEDRTGPLDKELFRAGIEAVTYPLRKVFPGFSFLDPKRYLVAELPSDSKDMGGFHSDYGIGYQYLSDYAFSVMLRSDMGSKSLRTLEFLRNYLHDSIHSSTFKTFRKAVHDDSPYGIYRHQYGINFRNEAQMSFSPAKSNNIPHTINLNLLMDGIIVVAVAQALASFTKDLDRKDFYDPNRKDLQKAIFLEVIGDLKRSTQWKASVAFNQEVPFKTEQFLEYWGGSQITEAVGEAMMTGKLGRLLHYFNSIGAEKINRDQEFSLFIAARKEELTTQDVRDNFVTGNFWNLLFLSKDFRAKAFL